MCVHVYQYVYGVCVRGWGGCVHGVCVCICMYMGCVCVCGVGVCTVCACAQRLASGEACVHTGEHMGSPLPPVTGPPSLLA